MEVIWLVIVGLIAAVNYYYIDAFYRLNKELADIKTKCITGNANYAPPEGGNTIEPMSQIKDDVTQLLSALSGQLKGAYV